MEIELKINTDEGFKSQIIDVSSEVYEELKNFAKEQGCSVEQVIKFILMKELKQYVS